MTAAIVPFPQVRRRRFIAKTANRLATVNPRTAEKLLAATLHQQAHAMQRKQLAVDVVERECRSLESAIRGGWWRSITDGGRA
jgi:hypothetical protein